jgi:hypothetical protein
MFYYILDFLISKTLTLYVQLCCFFAAEEN